MNVNLFFLIINSFIRFSDQTFFLRISLIKCKFRHRESDSGMFQMSSSISFYLLYKNDLFLLHLYQAE